MNKEIEKIKINSKLLLNKFQDLIMEEFYDHDEIYTNEIFQIIYNALNQLFIIITLTTIETISDKITKYKFLDSIQNQSNNIILYIKNEINVND